MSETVNGTAVELAREFPLLWEIAQAYDFAERLGGCGDPLYAEVDAALRELWMARTNAGRVEAAEATKARGADA